MKSVMTVKEASELIRSGKRMFIAGDERLLAALPSGEWIGGTIPYFMSEDGGLFSKDLLQAIVLPDAVAAATVKLYEPGELDRIPGDYPSNGFAYAVIPAFSQAHQTFAQDCSTWEGVFDRPLVGWIAGIDLKDLGKASPRVFNGQSGESSTSKTAVMHVELPGDKLAKANIINLFRQGNGSTITFPKSGFEAAECFVDGAKRNFAEYVTSAKIDNRLPLVADYMGAMVNVSFQAVDASAGKVTFYAPVFPGVEYKIADPVPDYETAFREELGAKSVSPVFTCNCILNYLYANLEGKKTGHIVGPITFGEIAYMLLNQTLVYLTFESR
jgi:hypothetical protein